MSDGALAEMVEELAAISGVRGAMIATVDGALGDGRWAGLDTALANDVAKTVRRMVVASSTVGAPLEELAIDFGGAQMLIVPLRDDSTLVILLEQGKARDAVRSLLEIELDRVRQVISDDEIDLDSGGDFELDTEVDDEIDGLLEGELGETLQRIEDCYSNHAQRMGVTLLEAHGQMREQLREWLLCCNPSSYTFPLLLDGLAQTLNAEPGVRADFTNEVQIIMRAEGTFAKG